MYYVIYLVSALLLAELLSGIFHWWEDRYGNPDWPIIGKYIIQPNITHHENPTLFCKNSYWNRNYTTIVPSLIISLICYYFSLYFLSICFLFVSQSNEIHAWSHIRCNKFIRFLQRYGIVQSPRQHSIHHKKPYDKYYCVLTNYLNPVLNYVKFWDRLEYCINLFGIRPRKERELA